MPMWKQNGRKPSNATYQIGFDSIISVLISYESPRSYGLHSDVLDKSDIFYAPEAFSKLLYFLHMWEFKSDEYDCTIFYTRLMFVYCL